MATAVRKTELSTLESLVVERALGDETHARSANNPLARIQALTQERQRLYAKSASHPFLAPMNRARILAIGAEIDLLWEALRRQRASRRTQIERALNVIAEDDEERDDDPDEKRDSDHDERHERVVAHEAQEDRESLRPHDQPINAPATRRRQPKRNTRNDTDAA